MEYPISYEEYEKKVFEEFSQIPSDLTATEQTKILQDFLEEDKGFMERAYKASGSLYNQNINNWKEIGMTDEQILERFMSYPIHNLKLILGFD